MTGATADAATPEENQASVPDDVWRAGADPIEAEDQRQGYLDVIDADPLSQAMEDRVDAPETEDEPAPEETAAAEEPQDAEPEVAEEDAATPEEDAAEEEGEDVPPAEAAADTDGEEAPAEEEPAEPIMVPKSRMDQETARRRAAENQLREIQKNMNSGEDSPVDTKRQLEEVALDFGDAPKQMFNKILDGDIDAANGIFADIMKQVATSGAQAGYEQARGEISDVVQQTQQQDDVGAVIADLESTYDFFNPGSEAFEADAVTETLALQEGFIAQGYTPADAMRTASDYYLRVHKPELLQPAAPAPQGEQAPTKPAPAPTRKKEVERNLAASKQQPPAVAPAGGNETVTNDLPDITKLSEEEIDALPEATIKRLRGDFL